MKDISQWNVLQLQDLAAGFRSGRCGEEFNRYETPEFHEGWRRGLQAKLLRRRSALGRSTTAPTSCAISASDISFSTPGFPGGSSRTVLPDGSMPSFPEPSTTGARSNARLSLVPTE